MNVTVLLGGPSAERQISLVSGAAVAAGLRQAGHSVYESDISPSDLSGLDQPADVIFPVLHGEFGEDGQLQEILEARKLAFVGSGSKASRIGMDKVACKELWHQAGLPTAPWEVRTTTEPGAWTGPVVVKAISSGSSIDVFVCKDHASAANAVAEVVGRHGKALVEQFVPGIELTVGLLEEQPLEPIRIVPRSEFFDYQAKYQANDTEHRFDTGLPARVVEHCRELARQANAVVGARDLARIDIIVDSQHRPWLLEINTLPGFTPKSLLPEAAAHAGMGFPALVDRLVRRAQQRFGRFA
jgi:D-alanine-D-alanine ligase